ncbi:hypothetical protein BC826DRAFT_916936, partial [Russula brevipes]
PSSMPHTTSSHPTPLPPEASSSTSPSSSDTTRYVVRNGGPSLRPPSLTTCQGTPEQPRALRTCAQCAHVGPAPTRSSTRTIGAA